MIYNDYPILSNEAYNNISKEFSNQIRSRKEYANTLFFELSKTLNICISIKNVNQQIKKELNNSKILIEQILENLTANFSIEKPSITEINNFSIFSYLNLLSQTLLTTTNWLMNEEKYYYKTFIKNTTCTILEMLKNIFKSVNNSNVILFKHM